MGSTGSTPFGRWLMAAREFHGISLGDVAERAGVSKGHLSKIENDPEQGDNITLAVAEKIARVFGMPLWQVLKRISAANTVPNSIVSQPGGERKPTATAPDSGAR